MKFIYEIFLNKTTKWIPTMCNCNNTIYVIITVDLFSFLWKTSVRFVYTIRVVTRTVYLNMH